MVLQKKFAKSRIQCQVSAPLAELKLVAEVLLPTFLPNYNKLTRKEASDVR